MYFIEMQHFLNFHWTITVIFGTQILIGAKSETVTLYKESYAKGESLELIVSNCTNSLPPEFLGKVACGNFSVSCAQFYDGQNCTGNSVELYKDKLHNLPWKLRNVKSIGPCEPHFSCNVSNETNTDIETSDAYIADNIMHPIFLEFYDQPNFKGRRVAMKLKNFSCYELPRSLKHKVSSIRLPLDTCIELYSGTDCSQEQLTLKKSRPTVINTLDWGLDNKIASISPCGFSCKKRNSSLISNYEPIPRLPHITLFDELSFGGNYKHIVVKQNCINLDVDWEGVALSMISYQECIVIYNLFDCGNQESSHFKQNLAFHQKVLIKPTKTFFGGDLEIFGFDGQLRSIGPCATQDAPAHIAIYVLAGLFASGVIMAYLINWIVLNRDRKERQIQILYDKPTM